MVEQQFTQKAVSVNPSGISQPKINCVSTWLMNLTIEKEKKTEKIVLGSP